MPVTRIATILRDGQPGQQIVAKGWVRTRRDSKNSLSFIELNDGSCMKNLQIVAEYSVAGLEEQIRNVTTGASLAVHGLLSESPGKGQRIELHATSIEVLGTADPQTYPLQKKGHTFEFLRDIAHLRPRTNTFGAVARVRNRISWSIHSFFQNRGFLYLNTPIVTTSDCEGAGEMFQVTTLDLAMLAKKQIDSIDWKQDFFGKPASLTVSGQLEAETYATAVGDVYTFGPTFRAENSHTSRHLAEFWMIEPEIAFATLEEDMALAEDYLKYCTQWVLDHCADDLAFFEQQFE
ncbi:MAG: Asparagine--tRNA ligase, partial [Planctomycetota bacterium]